MRVLALIQKEWLLLLRDWHALLLLFAMPAAFILVMSLALQNKFELQQGVSIPYYLVNQDHSPQSDALAQELARLRDFRANVSSAPLTELRRQVREDHMQFLVVIPPGFGAAMQQPAPRPLLMLAGPGTEPAVFELFAAALRAALARVYLRDALAPMTPDLAAADRLLQTESLYRGDAPDEQPSSVQQSVPAWLLFAMFFIAVPLSTTWVQERQLGTYARLRSMGLSTAALLVGKLVPYLAITLVQVILMLAVGVWLVPWLGGDALTLGQAPLALAIMALAAAFAAVAYALLIANWVTTSEQAMLFTGVANLLMAAVGGIMVPRFLMPPMMQTLSHYSPMAWGLDGFLDVFLRRGGLSAVAPQAAALCVFGLACLLLAAWRFQQRNRA
jgi:ABC-2 type transport system permease protein